MNWTLNSIYIYGITQKQKFGYPMKKSTKALFCPSPKASGEYTTDLYTKPDVVPAL